MFLLREHHYYNGGKKEENIKILMCLWKKKCHERPYDLKALLSTVTSHLQVLRCLPGVQYDPVTSSPRQLITTKRKKEKKNWLATNPFMNKIALSLYR